MNVQTNDERQQYVLRYGQGSSCWGFDNAFEETEALAKCLERADLIPQRSEWGTPAVLEKHAELIQLAAGRDLGTWFNPRTPDAVRKLLEKLRKSGDEVRLFYGDPDTGRDWMEENDVIGRVGRSTGTLKIPLLIPDGDIGGPGILDSHVIRMIRVRDRKELYRHPTYRLPAMEVAASDTANYPFAVLVDGAVHARFPTLGAAHHWVAFMHGTSMEAP